jgi:hypothetical protein
MTKDWKKIAGGLNLEIPESELEGVGLALDELDAVFHPLLQLLSPVTEPAFHFECEPEEHL